MDCGAVHLDREQMERAACRGGGLEEGRRVGERVSSVLCLQRLGDAEEEIFSLQSVLRKSGSLKEASLEAGAAKK